MSLFLDSGNMDEILKYYTMGIIRGVTTNPSIILKDKISGGIKGLEKRIVDIAKLIKPYPLSVEVLSNDKKEMLEQAKYYSSLEENIVIKIPIHGPEGEIHNLEIINELENKYKIKVNVTAMMSAQQGLLACLANATYVSLFGGRINNMGYNSCDEIVKLRHLIDLNNFKSKIIIGSTREILNIIDWLNSGAHIVTVIPDLLKGMIVHPYSKETVKMFIDDANKLINS